MGVDVSCVLTLTGRLAPAAFRAPLGKVNLNGVDDHAATNCSL